VHLYLVLNSGLEGMLLFLLASQRERTGLLNNILAIKKTSSKYSNSRAPLASLGAVFRQLEHSREEQGIS